MKKSTKKGFTLAELLIVIAIIAVLIAIMFPVFGAQLNKAKAAAELANVRAKYSELVADAMLGGTGTELTADVSVSISFADLAKSMQYKKSTVTYDPSNDTIEVEFEGYKGSFKVDTDVELTDGAATPVALSAKTKYYNSGSATPQS